MLCNLILDQTGGTYTAEAERGVDLDDGSTGVGHGEGVGAGGDTATADDGDRRREKRAQSLESIESVREEGLAGETADLVLVAGNKIELFSSDGSVANNDAFDTTTSHRTRHICQLVLAQV